ncbi:MAG: hypothetical protein GY711_11445 [bacterium]|nr:hypothetical protein [bacterium]
MAITRELLRGVLSIVDATWGSFQVTDETEFAWAMGLGSDVEPGEVRAAVESFIQAGRSQPHAPSPGMVRERALEMRAERRRMEAVPQLPVGACLPFALPDDRPLTYHEQREVFAAVVPEHLRRNGWPSGAEAGEQANQWADLGRRHGQVFARLAYDRDHPHVDGRNAWEPEGWLRKFPYRKQAQMQEPGHSVEYVA